MDRHRQLRRGSAVGRISGICLLSLSLLSRAAYAGGEDPKALASGHFQQGVALFGEADYNAALVEFKAAYSIAPNVEVLFNIGQTEFQLQRYAAALATLEKYVADGGTAHKADAAQQISTLKARVGRLALTVDVKGCEVHVDDEVVGTTPLANPIVVTIGRRRLSVVPPGGSPQTRFVDIASNETTTLTIKVDTPASQPGFVDPPAEQRNSHDGLVLGGWITTGVLGAATLTTGLLALNSASKLKDAREKLDPNETDLANRQDNVKALEITTDILGVATIAAAGLSLYWTITNGSSSNTKVGFGPGRLSLVRTF
jgi:hypothetical protein